MLPRRIEKLLDLVSDANHLAYQLADQGWHESVGELKYIPAIKEIRELLSKAYWDLSDALGDEEEAV